MSEKLAVFTMTFSIPEANWSTMYDREMHGIPDPKKAAKGLQNFICNEMNNADLVAYVDSSEVTIEED